MNSKISRILTGLILVALFCFSASGVNAATITKTLDANTKFIPSGLLATDDPPTF